jgi:hypothetical protein
MEGATASGWLEVRYIAAGVASRQAQVVLQRKGMEMSFSFSFSCHFCHFCHFHFFFSSYPEQGLELDSSLHCTSYIQSTVNMNVTIDTQYGVNSVFGGNFGVTVHGLSLTC